MEKREYPKWKYHKTKDAVVVKCKQSEEVLGKAWADSPAEFEKKDVVKEAIKIDEKKPTEKKN